jgi:hypothetical protein
MKFESENPDTVLFHALGAWRVSPVFHDILWAPAFRMVAYQLIGKGFRIKDKERAFIENSFILCLGDKLMKRAKKILNNPREAVRETLEGLVLAYQGEIIQLENANAFVKTVLPPDKVGLLVGGGSGHEPLFPGFIGENLADGAAF